MGYSYGRNPRTGAECLSCDSCGKVAGTTRKRKCTQRVKPPGFTSSIPYCYPPALCPECYKREGGAKIHRGCKEPAAKSQAKYDEEQAKFEAGDLQRQTAWGDWHAQVPEGKVGFAARSLQGEEQLFLVNKDDFDRMQEGGIKFLQEIDEAGIQLEPWGGPQGPTTKQVVMA